jgi:AraC-like DNA-binding protein/tetratricopeptide (TPR) repeat protein
MRYIIFWGYLILIFGILSCTTGKQPKEWMQRYRQAQNYLNSHTDSTILITNNLIAQAAESNIPKKGLLEILQLRQSAFAKQKNMDSVMSVMEQIRQIAAQIPDSIAMAQSLLLIKGDIDFSKRQKLEEYLPEAITTFRFHKMEYEQAQACASYGAILCQKGDIPKAQAPLFQAYEIFTKLDSVRGLIGVCNNIGNAFRATKSADEALKYFNLAYEGAKKYGNPIITSSTLMNIGILYLSFKKDPDKALSYCNQALAILPKEAPYLVRMKVEYNIAQVDLIKNNYQHAELVFKNILDSCLVHKNLEGVLKAREGLADVYNQKGDPEAAIIQRKLAIHMADSLGMTHVSMNSKHNLLSYYQKKNDFQKAFQTLQEIVSAKDSLQSKEKQLALLDLEKKYESEKKEAAIKNLEQVSDLRFKLLLGLSLVLLIVIFLWWQRNRLYREKNIAYAVLIRKYKEENEAFERMKATQNSRVSPDPELEDGLTVKTEALLMEEIRRYFQEEKPYLNSKLKIEDISARVNISSRILGNLFKKYEGVNFATYVNQFRISESQQRLGDPKYQNYKIEAIADESGFGSRQSFYTVFEQQIGMQPSTYRRSIMSTRID